MSPLTVAWVPTGMNAGVSTVPLRVSSRPSRASEPGSTTWVVNRTGGHDAVAAAAGVRVVKPVFPEAPIRPRERSRSGKNAASARSRARTGLWPVTVLPVVNRSSVSS